jgi:hypothetical protein
LIQTSTANRGLVFDPIKTQELPLNGRQSYMLMALTPGVIFTQEQFGANGFSGTRGWVWFAKMHLELRPTFPHR